MFPPFFISFPAIFSVMFSPFSALFRHIFNIIPAIFQYFSCLFFSTRAHPCTRKPSRTCLLDPSMFLPPLHLHPSMDQHTIRSRDRNMKHTSSIGSTNVWSILQVLVTKFEGVSRFFEPIWSILKVLKTLVIGDKKWNISSKVGTKVGSKHQVLYWPKYEANKKVGINIHEVSIIYDPRTYVCTGTLHPKLTASIKHTRTKNYSTMGIHMCVQFVSLCMYVYLTKNRQHSIVLLIESIANVLMQLIHFYWHLFYSSLMTHLLVTDLYRVWIVCYFK